jgi:hypothetical protein
MRAEDVPGTGATAGAARLVVTAAQGLAGRGGVAVDRDGRRVLWATLPAAQLRNVVRRWAAAARLGLGELTIAE